MDKLKKVVVYLKKVQMKYFYLQKLSEQTQYWWDWCSCQGSKYVYTLIRTILQSSAKDQSVVSEKYFKYIIVVFEILLKNKYTSTNFL